MRAVLPSLSITACSAATIGVDDLHPGAYATAGRPLVLGGSSGVRRCAGHHDATVAGTGGAVEGRLFHAQWGAQFEIGVRF